MWGSLALLGRRDEERLDYTAVMKREDIVDGVGEPGARSSTPGRRYRPQAHFRVLHTEAASREPLSLFGARGSRSSGKASDMRIPPDGLDARRLTSAPPQHEVLRGFLILGRDDEDPRPVLPLVGDFPLLGSSQSLSDVVGRPAGEVVLEPAWDPRRLSRFHGHAGAAGTQSRTAANRPIAATSSTP